MSPAEGDLRRRILGLVEEFPGLHLRELARRADCTTMVAEHYLNILERLGLVTSQRQARYRVFFPVRSGPMHLEPRDRRWLSVLRRPQMLGLALLLLERGTVRLQEAADAMGLPLSTAAYQVSVLKDAGLVVPDVEDHGFGLADPERVLTLLTAYRPTRDAVTRYAELWSRVFSAARAPAAPAPSAPLPPEVEALSRGPRVVYTALLKGPMTQQQLRRRTGLARRTVYTALQTLEALGVLEQQVRLSDTRMTWYWLRETSTEEVDGPGRSDEEG